MNVSKAIHKRTKVNGSKTNTASFHLIIIIIIIIIAFKGAIRDF